MKRNILLLTALGAALFGVVSCKEDKGTGGSGEAPKGKEMSATEIAAFVEGYVTKYGEDSSEVPNKLEDLFATTKIATVTGSKTNKTTIGEESRSSTQTLAGEYNFTEPYLHLNYETKSITSTTRTSKEEVFYVKEGEAIMEYSENMGNKVASASANTIYQSAYYRLMGFTGNYLTEALTYASDYDTYEAEKELKMYKEDSYYFATFKDVEENAEEKIKSETIYKFRYNKDYLPIYMYSKTTTSSDGETTYKQDDEAEYKIEAKESITKATFDKTQYETHAA